MTISVAVKQRIFELCRERKLSINRLGIISGVPQSTLNNFVSGRNHSMTVSTLQKLCDGLEITIREFFASPCFDSIEQEIQ